jgi:polyisoprenoid-binding protein YceI
MPVTTRTTTDVLAGTWVIDTSRATVAFSGRTSPLMPKLEAWFGGVEGAITVPAQRERLGGGDVEVLVDVRTVATRRKSWDEVLGTLDPFESARHPYAAYRSREVVWRGDRVTIDGTLTLRGVTRSVPLQATYAGDDGSDRMRVQAHGQVDRQEFGIRTDVPCLTALTPRRMSLDIDLELVRL